MDAGLVVAMMVIGIGLAISYASYCLLGGVTCLLFRRLFQSVSRFWRDKSDQASDEEGGQQKFTMGIANMATGKAMWAWPLAGLLLGSLIAYALRSVSREQPIYDLDYTRERLTKAYNPLLMQVNELRLDSGKTDMPGLELAYRSIRPTLYEQSHLLSRHLLQAAAKADACLGDADPGRLIACLRTLRAQITADHSRLLRQLELVGHNGYRKSG